MSAEAKKRDLDILLNVALNKWFKFFIGPKYQGYVIGTSMEFYTPDSSTPYIPFKQKVLFNSIGGGLGGAVNFQMFSNLFFVSNITAIYLIGKDFAPSAKENGNGNMTNILGGSGMASLAFYVEPVRTTFTAGIRGQYLRYITSVNQTFVQKYDLFWGPYLSVVYTF